MLGIFPKCFQDCHVSQFQETLFTFYSMWSIVYLNKILLVTLESSNTLALMKAVQSFSFNLQYKLMSWIVLLPLTGFPGGTSGEEPACQYKRHQRCGFDPWVRKILWRRAWQPAPVFLPGESHGQRSLANYSPQGHKELDMTEVTWHRTAQHIAFHWRN